CFAFLAYLRPAVFGRITASVFGFTIILVILYYQIELFNEGLAFLSLRFEEAANVEGTPFEAYITRYWEIIRAPWYFGSLNDLWGMGLGAGTRAGAAIGYGMPMEIEWGRHVKESGMIMGCLYVAIRIWISKDLLAVCLNAVKRDNYLAIFLWGACAPVILFGILGQPTNLGFAAFGGGLCLAAANTKIEHHRN
ncbi:uncharacterized protein METZ01_LOCUS476312, partial [marine metagenome]